MTRASSTAAPAASGLDTLVGQSGLQGASTLRRNGRRMGISSVRDLLTTFPRRYEDLREIVAIGRLPELEPGTPVTVRASVASLRVEKTVRRRVQRTIAVLQDGSGEVEVVWFGRRFIERQLKVGDRVVASGKVKLRGWRAQLDNPEFQRDDGGDMLHVGRIVPIYRLTRGVTARTLRAAIRSDDRQIGRPGPITACQDPYISKQFLLLNLDLFMPNQFQQGQKHAHLLRQTRWQAGGLLCKSAFAQRRRCGCCSL